MGKKIFFVTTMLLNNYLASFEQLPSECRVTYGNSDAPIKITEYFSLSCSKCIETFRKEFHHLREKYINSQEVYWVFHPHPADLLTLQAMHCMEKLSPIEKRIFLETIIETIQEPSEGCFAMQVAMQTFGKPIPQLSDLKYLKNTFSFSRAFRYLNQPDVLAELPTVEINGVIYDEFPNSKFLEQQFSTLLERRKKA